MPLLVQQEEGRAGCLQLQLDPPRWGVLCAFRAKELQVCAGSQSGGMNRRGAHLWDVLSSPGWVLLKYSIFLFKTIFVRERHGIFIYIFSLCHKALLYVRRLEVTRQVLARMLYKGSMHFMFHANSRMQLSALCLVTPALRKNNCNSGSTARLAISMYCKEFPLTSTLSRNGNSSLLSVLKILYKRWWLRCACLHPATRGLTFKVPEIGDAECAAAPAFCTVLKRKSLQFSLLSIGQKNL